MSHPQISILVCTRDRQEQLLRCLQSLLQLKHNSFEIVVVDNASRAFRVPDLDYSRPTRFFRQSQPGLSRTRNAILPVLNGEIIALIDDDAIADPDWLTEGCKGFSDAETGCITGRILPLNQHTEWQKKQMDVGWMPVSTAPGVYDGDSFDPLTTSPGTGSNVFLRRALFEKIAFPEFLGPGTSAFAADEHYLFYKIIAAGWRIRYEPAAVVRHEFPASQDEYRTRMYRCSVSRGAYLARFIFAEDGQRMKTVRYVIDRAFGRSVDANAGKSEMRMRGLIAGPWRLLQSTWHARRERRIVCEQIAEFGRPD